MSCKIRLWQEGSCSQSYQDGYVDKQGRRRVYSSAYLRRTYREAGKVKNETVADLSALPDHVIDLIDAGLKGTPPVPAAEASPSPVPCRMATSPPSLPWPGSWGCLRCWARRARSSDLALALVISRVVRPGSKLSTLARWADTTLGADLGVADASTDEIYAAMDWLARRQDDIEAGLAGRHLAQRPTRRGWRCST